MNIIINQENVYYGLFVSLIKDRNLYVSFRYSLMNNEQITINNNPIDNNTLLSYFLKYRYYNDLVSLLGYFNTDDNKYDWDKAIKTHSNQLSIFPVSNEWNVNDSIINLLDKDETFNSLNNDIERTIYIFYFLCYKLKFDNNYYRDFEYKVICTNEQLKRIDLDDNNYIICFSFSIIFDLLLERYCSIDKCTITNSGQHYFNLVNDRNSIISFDGTNNRVKDLALIKLGLIPGGITYFFGGNRYTDEVVRNIFNLFCKEYNIDNISLKKLINYIINHEEIIVDEEFVNYFKYLDDYKIYYIIKIFKIYYEIDLHINKYDGYITFIYGLKGFKIDFITNELKALNITNNNV